MSKTKCSVFFVALCWLLGASTAQAAQYKTLGDWDVHYIVFNTSFLEPEIARAYQIQRSKFQGLVNISVLNSSDQKAQNVALSGTATNLLGTVRQLNFRQVVDGDAIYYLATIPFRDMEDYRFSVDIRRGNEVQTLKFRHQFYSD